MISKASLVCGALGTLSGGPSLETMALGIIELNCNVSAAAATNELEQTIYDGSCG